MEKNTINGRPVPPWVLVVTYCLGWAFGSLLILEAVFGLVESRLLFFTAGLYLLLFPLLRESPDRVLKRMFGGG